MPILWRTRSGPCRRIGRSGDATPLAGRFRLPQAEAGGRRVGKDRSSVSRGHASRHARSGKSPPPGSDPAAQGAPPPTRASFGGGASRSPGGPSSAAKGCSRASAKAPGTFRRKKGARRNASGEAAGTGSGACSPQRTGRVQRRPRRASAPERRLSSGPSRRPS